MNKHKIVTKINLFFVLSLLFAFSTACKEVKTGKATYTFTIKVSEEFMQKERETAEAMAGGDEELLKEVMEHITKMNTKRIYSLFFQENKTVFSMDTEWNGQEDPNKIYVDYQTKEVIFPSDSEVKRETFPKEKWVITDEFKKIGDWDVQKATARFGGQVITAWFSKHPTLRITPREYVGLEGIVVEIQLEAGAKYTLTNFELDKSIKVDLP